MFQRMENSPHCSAKLLVVHGRVFPPVTPQSGDLFTADKAEDTIVVVIPTDETRAVLRLLEQITDELPQLAISFF
jgi:glycerol-3-phosphate dehydrogenase